MKKYIERLPEEIRELIYFAKELAAYRGAEAYLVGGFVRDMLLGVKNFDLDIVVVGDGIRFGEYFAKLLKGKLVRHRRFGTATLVLKHGLKIDFASARSEVYPEPASLPIVRPGSLKDDLYRRDFTINAMAVSLKERDFGSIVDYFGGKQDLDSGKIRILHDLSFIDDPTRLIRAVRFKERYGFSIEPRTLGRFKEAVRLCMLEKVEPQRIRDDIILLLKEDNPARCVLRLRRLSGFKFIDRRLNVSNDTVKLLHSVQRQVAWFIKAHPERRKPDKWLVYFMALTASLSTRSLKLIIRRLALKKGEEKRIMSYHACVSKVASALKRKSIPPSGLSAILEPLSYEVILLLKARYSDRNLQDNIRKFFVYLNGMRIHIRGEDLHLLGLKPGPHYQRILKAVLAAKLDGKVGTREEELHMAKELFNKI
jgi:tRNA nucleotidyltransferase (CCA-adding enzyme)